ncbi:MAG: Mur ligase family protein [Patescibacteria group bacterium]
MKTNSILTILQQSEYDLKYFQRWYKRRKEENFQPKAGPPLAEKPEKLTTKLRLIKTFYSLLFIFPVLIRIKLILLIIKPVEFLIRFVIYFLANSKLFFLKILGLKVVAIAGSYGKTSVKHIMSNSLRKQTPTLATAKSINTPLGIALTILTKLKVKHKLFIVELGEHKRGDIRQLCQLVRPQFGILTPIGRQHLERMESLKNIVKTFSELLEYFNFDKNKLLIADENHKYFEKHKLHYYGKEKKLKNKDQKNFYSLFFILSARVSRSGTEFKVGSHDKKTKMIFSPLYGEHQAANTLPTFWLTNKLNLSTQKLIAAIAQLPYIPHRHQPFFAANDVLILDNGYNSNPDSVKSSLKLINQLNPTHRIIITPGFLELGKESEKIHKEFGKTLAKQIDYLGLLDFPDQANIIKGFLKTGGKKSQIFTGNTQEEILNKLKPKIIKGSVILFENGVNELYR